MRMIIPFGIQLSDGLHADMVVLFVPGYLRQGGLHLFAGGPFKSAPAGSGHRRFRSLCESLAPLTTLHISQFEIWIRDHDLARSHGVRRAVEAPRLFEKQNRRHNGTSSSAAGGSRTRGERCLGSARYVRSTHIVSTSSAITSRCKMTSWGNTIASSVSLYLWFPAYFSALVNSGCCLSNNR
jgi:hypothetical protein